jgi:hypothetical protein
MSLPEWKMVVLARYGGEYPPATDSAKAIRKSSEDIAFDLAGMGDFSADEVSVYMAVHGYRIEFDDDRPVWLLSPSTPDDALPELLR